MTLYSEELEHYIEKHPPDSDEKNLTALVIRLAILLSTTVLFTTNALFVEAVIALVVRNKHHD